MSRIWEELYGPSYYYFIYRNVLFLCLNSEESTTTGEGTAGIDESNLIILRKFLLIIRMSDGPLFLCIDHYGLMMKPDTGMKLNHC